MGALRGIGWPAQGIASSTTAYAVPGPALFVPTVFAPPFINENNSAVIVFQSETTARIGG